VEGKSGVEGMTGEEMEVAENKTAIVIVTVIVTSVAKDFVSENKSPGAAQDRVDETKTCSVILNRIVFCHRDWDYHCNVSFSEGSHFYSSCDFGFGFDCDFGNLPTLSHSSSSSAGKIRATIRSTYRRRLFLQ